MDTGKSISESNGSFSDNAHKAPDYLSGKIIDGLNGKLFNTEKGMFNTEKGMYVPAETKK